MSKPWNEMTELERFADDLEGTLLAHADPADVAIVMQRLQRVVDAECLRRSTETAPIND